MRHRLKSQRLSRNYSQRKAMLRNMAISLFAEQRIKTTLAKAKELRRLVEPIITLSKNGSLASRRRAYNILGSRTVVAMLFKELAPLFKKRAGGYTRILRLSSPRSGDGANMVFIELTEKRALEPAKEKPKVPEARPKPVEKPKQEEKPKPVERPKQEEKPKLAEHPKAEEKKPKEEKKPGRGLFEGLKKFFKKDK